MWGPERTEIPALQSGQTDLQGPETMSTLSVANPARPASAGDLGPGTSVGSLQVLVRRQAWLPPILRRRSCRGFVLPVGCGMETCEMAPFVGQKGLNVRRVTRPNMLENADTLTSHLRARGPRGLHGPSDGKREEAGLAPSGTSDQLTVRLELTATSPLHKPACLPREP